MKKIAAIVSLSITGVLLFGMSGFCGPVMAEAKALRIVVPSPPGESGWPMSSAITDMADKFNKRTDGAFVVKVYYGGDLAKLPEYMDAVRVRVAEMAFSPWSSFSSMEPQLAAAEIPFLFNTDKAATAAIDKMLPLYDGILQSKFNAKGLAMANIGNMDIFAVRPLKTLDDISGLTVASLTPCNNGFLESLGASPVTIMVTDVYQSLKSNSLQATTQSIHGIVALNMTDIVSHAVMFNGAVSMFGIQINLDAWKEMPPQIQAVLQEEATRAAAWLSDITATEVLSKDMSVFKEKKIEVYQLPKAEREKWVAKTKPYIDAQIAKAGELGQQVKQIAAEVNERYPYEAK